MQYQYVFRLDLIDNDNPFGLSSSVIDSVIELEKFEVCFMIEE
ncbi:hypothetical protein [Borrelia miyamotoi]|nr:hypothetical protein [Borrelia miyamotoi]WEG99530.1 hypothetical protein EZU69_07060 [Borrelia miyamotoi]